MSEKSKKEPSMVHRWTRGIWWLCLSWNTIRSHGEYLLMFRSNIDNMVSQSTYICIEYQNHSECPLVGIWTPPPPLLQECVPHPSEQKGGGHTCLREREWGSPNSDDWRKSLALCLLCVLCYFSLADLDWVSGWQGRKVDRPARRTGGGGGLGLRPWHWTMKRYSDNPLFSLFWCTISSKSSDLVGKNSI